MSEMPLWENALGTVCRGLINALADRGRQGIGTDERDRYRRHDAATHTWCMLIVKVVLANTHGTIRNVGVKKRP